MRVIIEDAVGNNNDGGQSLAPKVQGKTKATDTATATKRSKDQITRLADPCSFSGRKSS